MPHAVPDTPASAAPLDASVLYVEDDSFALRANAKLLGKMVSTLHTAQNGQEGLLVFSRHDPDIVITDVLMPKMDGLEMISHIRGMKPDVQVIVATSFDEPNFLHRAIRVGVDDYVLKPIDGSALRFALEKCYRRLCDRRRSTEHQRFAELMLGGLPHPAMLIDRDHQTVVTANPYAMELGFTPGVSCHGPLFPSSLASPNPLEDAFTPKPYSPSTIREAAAFDRVWDISLIPVSVSTLLLFAVDVTEHNRLQRLREDVERMVHHDMKAPLSGIIGMAQMLLDPGDLLDARTCAQSILDGSRHILTMLDLSLDLFKMEEGIYRPAKTTFDLAGMLMRLEREFTSLTKERTLRILYRLDNAPWDLQQPCPFHSEPRLAHTLLGNLIQNAPGSCAQGERRAHQRIPGHAGHHRGPQPGRRARGDPQPLFRPLCHLGETPRHRSRHLQRPAHGAHPRRRHHLLHFRRNRHQSHGHPARSLRFQSGFRFRYRGRPTASRGVSPLNHVRLQQMTRRDLQ